MTPEQLERLKIFKDFESKVPAQAEVSKKNPDSGYLMIFSDVNWTATVLDSGLDTFTQDGSKNSVIEFECVLETGTYSLSVQKDTEAGFLFLGLIQNGNTIKLTRLKKEDGKEYQMVSKKISLPGSPEENFIQAN